MHKHCVTFYSPGTLFDEETTKPIEKWDPRLAVGMSETIVERHGSKPYGFRFSTYLTAAPVPDGQGGFLQVEHRFVRMSGIYFLGGRLETLDKVEARRDPGEKVLRSNMRTSWPIVIVSERSYKTTRPFEQTSMVVDAQGRITERGDDAGRIAYRKSVLARKD